MPGRVCGLGCGRLADALGRRMNIGLITHRRRSPGGEQSMTGGEQVN